MTVTTLHEPGSPPEMPVSSASRRVVLDCRWLALGGTGRVTELLLADLARLRPVGRWTLWGDAALLAPRAWEGATLAQWDGDPRALFGQRDALRVPAGDVVVFLHQIRPLRTRPSITFVHDTIPLRHGAPAAVRAVKRLYLQRVASVSAELLTVSEVARGRIVADLGVEPSRVSVVRPGIDRDRAAAVAARREAVATSDRLLYVGTYAAHKNLGRLYRAFARSDFARQGGELLLVGGSAEGAARERAAARHVGARIDVRETCSEAELDDLYATSRALVAPALEEGFGLPAYEAAASGLPVAASDTGAARELPRDAVVLFDPWDVDAIADAIDVAVARRPSGIRDLGEGTLGAGVVRAVERVASHDPRRDSAV